MLTPETYTNAIRVASVAYRCRKSLIDVVVVRPFGSAADPVDLISSSRGRLQHGAPGHQGMRGVIITGSFDVVCDFAGTKLDHYLR